MKCKDCDDDSNDVEIVNCPIAENVRYEEVGIALCPDCYKERCKDI